MDGWRFPGDDAHPGLAAQAAEHGGVDFAHMGGASAGKKLAAWQFPPSGEHSVTGRTQAWRRRQPRTVAWMVVTERSTMGRKQMELEGFPRYKERTRAWRRRQPSTVAWMVATERSTLVLFTAGTACRAARATRYS